MCPSLAYASTLYVRPYCNVPVLVEYNEPEDRLLGRPRREVMKALVIQECKQQRFFENRQDERKRKASETARRTHNRKRPRTRRPGKMTTGKCQRKIFLYDSSLSSQTIFASGSTASFLMEHVPVSLRNL